MTREQYFELKATSLSADAVALRAKLAAEECAKQQLAIREKVHGLLQAAGLDPSKNYAFDDEACDLIAQE